MEEENLNMGMFGEGMELNIDFNPFQDHLENTEEEIIKPVFEGDQEDTDEQDNAVESEDSEEVDGEEDGQDEGSDDDDAEGKSSSDFTSLATVLHEQGLLPSLDIEKDSVKSIDDFINVFKKEQEIQAQLKLQEYIDHLDIEQIAQSKKNISDLSQITSEVLKDNLELAKTIIYEDYLNQGIDENKAKRLLKRTIDLGEEAILEDAEDSLVSIKEFESRKIEAQKANIQKQIENERLEQDKIDKALKETIYEKKDLVNGYKPTKAFQDKVYKAITEIVGKSPEGVFENKFMKERRENPVDFETRMYYFYELTNGFKDYSKLTTSAKSNAVKDLEKIARKTSLKDNGTPIWMQDNQSYEGKGPVILNI